MTLKAALAVSVTGLVTAVARVALTLAGHPALPWLDAACLALWLAALGLVFRCLRSLRRDADADRDRTPHPVRPPVRR